MSEEVKFTEDELKQVQQVQNDYRDIQDKYGQLSMARLRLEEQMNMLDESEEEIRNKFIGIQESEKKFLDEVTKKYGDGTLNPETGVFTPNKS